VEQQPWESGLSLDTSRDVLGAGGEAPDVGALTDLIGLVDELAELDPQALLAEAPAAPAPTPTAAPGAGAAPAWRPRSA